MRTENFGLVLLTFYTNICSFPVHNHIFFICVRHILAVLTSSKVLWYVTQVTICVKLLVSLWASSSCTVYKECLEWHDPGMRETGDNVPEVTVACLLCDSSLSLMLFWMSCISKCVTIGLRIFKIMN